jgi:hypothetical protein
VQCGTVYAKVVSINEFCRCACFCACVILTIHRKMSVTRMKGFVISKCSKSLGYNIGDEH